MVGKLNRRTVCFDRREHDPKCEAQHSAASVSLPDAQAALHCTILCAGPRVPQRRTQGKHLETDYDLLFVPRMSCGGNQMTP